MTKKMKLYLNYELTAMEWFTKQVGKEKGDGSGLWTRDELSDGVRDNYKQAYIFISTMWVHDMLSDYEYNECSDILMKKYVQCLNTLYAKA